MAPKSPATRSSSSATSFCTADGSVERPSTAASSPLQPTPCSYRETRQLPRELKEHCRIFFEEQLYVCAINLLKSAMGAGLSSSGSTRGPVFVPPPSHLALLSTLAVHPVHSTRANKPDDLVVPSLALDYLRNLLAVAGSVNAGFRTAFQFHPMPRLGRRAVHARHASDSDLSDADSDRDRLRGRMANESAIFSRARDFWSTVGWALNTAASYPHRWRYWKVWLEFMLDVLTVDWAERERIDREAHEACGSSGKEPDTARRESIIFMYMEQQDDCGLSTGFKRIIKALFADGGSLSSANFPEIFEKELRGSKNESKKRKWAPALDLDKDKFGDYLDDDSISSGVSEPPTPEKSRTSVKNVAYGTSTPGLDASIPLRLRLFSLLSAAVSVLRKQSQLSQLYEDFTVAVKLLPLPLFSLLVTQRENPLLPEAHVSITRELFHLLLPSNYKNPRHVDPDGDALGSLTMPMLEHCYISSAANTVGLEDNAKLSLTVENAIQLLWAADMVMYTDSFADAALRGIKAREAKAKKKRTGRMRVDPGDALAQDMLASSAARIHILLQLLRKSDAPNK